MKKSSVIGIVIVSVAVIGIGVAALSGNDSEDTGMGTMDMSQTSSGSKDSGSTMTAPNTVIIDNLDFQQPEITVKKGSTVTWKNQDTAKHNVVFDDKSVGEVEGSKLIAQGEELKFTFDTVGEFGYSCSPHPFMKAKIIVTE